MGIDDMDVSSLCWFNVRMPGILDLATLGITDVWADVSDPIT